MVLIQYNMVKEIDTVIGKVTEGPEIFWNLLFSAENPPSRELDLCLIGDLTFILKIYSELLLSAFISLIFSLIS